jgi:hypothetical protein
MFWGSRGRFGSRSRLCGRFQLGGLLRLIFPGFLLLFVELVAEKILSEAWRFQILTGWA